MILNKPHLLTKLEIWHPKYNTEHGDWEVWVLKRKVAYASPVILIEFTKAQHLIGQRFCMRRQVVEKCEVGTNGKAEVYRIPFNKLEDWSSAQEVREVAESLFN